MTSGREYRPGRWIVVLTALLLLIDAVLQFIAPPPLRAAFAHIGLQEGFQRMLPLITGSCALLLAVPSTSLIGAVATTAFLGGAITLHMRVEGPMSPPQLICVSLGIAMWTGMLLAKPQLRAILQTGRGRPRGSASVHAR